jgi:alcohol dehydrogenase YqhD (iron-dependent ADH family)
LKLLIETVSWNSGICANPAYGRLFGSITGVKMMKPDRRLAVGGDSVIDSTRFISAATLVPEDNNPWKTVIVDRVFRDKKTDCGCVLILPAIGSK